MLGVSELSPATSFTRSAVAAKVRTADRGQAAERTAAPNGRQTAWRRAIVGWAVRDSCGAAAGGRRRGGGGGGVVKPLLFPSFTPSNCSSAAGGWHLQIHVTTLRPLHQLCNPRPLPHPPRPVHPFLFPFTVGVRPFPCSCVSIISPGTGAFSASLPCPPQAPLRHA